MKIDLSQQLKNFKGANIEDDQGVPMTLGMVVAECLVRDAEAPRAKAFELAQQTFAAKEFEFNKADLALVKKALENSSVYGEHNTMILGQALTLLS